MEDRLDAKELMHRMETEFARQKYWFVAALAGQTVLIITLFEFFLKN